MTGLSTMLRRKINQLGLAVIVALLLIPVTLNSAPKPKPVPPPISLSQDGHLVYCPDSLGNRIPDFSYCGYQMSEEQIPTVPIKIVVPVINGDATEEIQKAINCVAELPPDKDGFRGAILLQPGTYKIAGRFNIKTSGIVIRGSGWNETVIIADGLSRETLFRINGEANKYSEEVIKITNSYVPVNEFQFDIENAKGLNEGDVIKITLPFSQDWINFIGMNDFGGETDAWQWRAGYHSMSWTRTVQKINGNSITIDAPITTPIDLKYGGASFVVCKTDNRIKNIGIENLSLQSSYNSNNLKDESHCWNAISFENAENCWVRQVKFKHFAGSAVAAFETASKITVEDCISTDPVSEIAAYRRNTFYNRGSLNLFQRLYAENGYHDFSTGFMATGPNAFVQCESVLPNNFSGAADSWASGALFDVVNVDGQKLSFANRGQYAQGAGWTAAFCVFWQCSAAQIENYAPPGAMNWAFGTWSQFAGNGYWYEPNSFVNPRSLFYKQLEERIGKDKIQANPLYTFVPDAKSQLTPELAAEIVEKFQTPVKSVRQWIEDEAAVRTPISIDVIKKTIVSTSIKSAKRDDINDTKPTQIVNGWLVDGETVITGSSSGVPWWNLKNKPRELERAQFALTRYVPGRIGKGYTDDLNDVMAELNERNIASVEQHYPLWYERRRDDHERIRRMDGDVWAPFYEQPFARSGEGLAWDHLSKYDLTKYNPWYWGRLKQFADMADLEGKILFHQNYFQHNILEAGAHWVDCPWRSVNNINDTGFPEPPPFAGDKRIFIADKFYDVTQPVRRELHKKYIRQCLENFKDNTCVIQATSAEYTGPFEFVAFWLDVIDEWEKENNKNVLVALSTTKDVQDSILADPVRSKIVDIIDIRYWSSRSDGSLYAPIGGANLAPRQFDRIGNPGGRSSEQVYSDVLSYRQNFPSKAVMYNENKSPNFGWAIFMASGSLAPIPKIQVEGFLESATSMKVNEELSKQLWTLGNQDGDFIVNTRENEINLKSFGLSGIYRVTVINPNNGSVISVDEKFDTTSKELMKTGSKDDAVIWLVKQ